ncbi:MAG: hypothetical protein JXB48_00320 [Candidatus Latescibacteria bacterium]|nr:hypothetical protein [Candidatus Latescibacterota bacterium]
MAELKKATPEDFENIYPLLLDFNNPDITKNMWKNIFSPPWKMNEDYCGYMLVDDNQIVGYLGYVFSRQYIDGNLTKFCNLTTWIVKEEHRGQSLELFYPAMKLEDYVVTDFSPTPSVLKMFEKRYKFKILEHGMLYSYYIPSINILRKKCKITFDDNIDTRVLSKKDALIHEDHKTLNIRRILIEDDDGYAYVVGKHKRMHKVRHLELIYISNPNIFARNRTSVINSICIIFMVLGIMIEQRLMCDVLLPHSYLRKPYTPKLYKTGIPIQTSDITHLYSEKVSF